MGLSDGEHRSVPEFNQMDLKDAIIKGYYGDEGYTAIRPTTYQKSDNRIIYNLNGTPTTHPYKGELQHLFSAIYIHSLALTFRSE